MRGPKLLTLKEMLILVLILSVLTTILFYTLGPHLGKTVSYVSIVVVTIAAIILKNIPLKQKSEEKSPPPKPAD